MIVAYVCFGIWLLAVVGFAAWAVWSMHKFNRDRVKHNPLAAPTLPAQPIPFPNAGPIRFPHSGEDWGEIAGYSVGSAELDAPEDTQ